MFSGARPIRQGARRTAAPRESRKYARIGDMTPPQERRIPAFGLRRRGGGMVGWRDACLAAALITALEAVCGRAPARAEEQQADIKPRTSAAVGRSPVALFATSSTAALSCSGMDAK